MSEVTFEFYVYIMIPQHAKLPLHSCLLIVSSVVTFENDEVQNDGCWTSRSTLCRGDYFYGGKPEYPEKKQRMSLTHITWPCITYTTTWMRVNFTVKETRDIPKGSYNHSILLLYAYDTHLNLDLVKYFQPYVLPRFYFHIYFSAVVWRF